MEKMNILKKTIVELAIKNVELNEKCLDLIRNEIRISRYLDLIKLGNIKPTLEEICFELRKKLSEEE